MTDIESADATQREAVVVSQPYHGGRFIISLDGGSLNGFSYPSAEAAQSDLDRIRAALSSSPAPAPAVVSEPVALKDCPIGLFVSEHGTLCLKTEYGTNEGRIDAYIVESGEFFWGGTNNASEQREVMVTPFVLAHPPEAEARIAELTKERDEAHAANLELAAVARDRRFVRCGDECYPDDPDPNCALEHKFQQQIADITAKLAAAEAWLETMARALGNLLAHPTNVDVIKAAQAALRPSGTAGEEG